MFQLGSAVLIIILVIVGLLFGVERIRKLAGEMGWSVYAFKDGLKSDNNIDNALVE